MPHVLPLSLQRRRPSRIRPRLGPLELALEALGNPQHQYPSILVTGSNGKGSTAAMLEAILAAHGLECGLYTSPHLVRVEERISTRGKLISTTELEHHLDATEEFPELTFFECLTAAAFLAFAQGRVGCAILEAGMGGRWDATRLAASRICGLTNVGTDHARWLGSARPDIAADKGAALAAAELGVIGAQVEESIIQHLAAPASVRADELVRVVAVGEERVLASWEGHGIELECPLPGRHQVPNLHLALALARAAQRLGLIPELDPEAVSDGLARVHWPGRLSTHRIRGRQITVDCAHNLEGVLALAAHLAREPSRHNLVFSCLGDKPIEEMADWLAPRVDRIALCPLDDERAMPADRLAAAFPGAAWADTPIGALELIPDPVLAAGSLRLVGALLEHEEVPP
jgi:dihydrofolate synthase/folylpolyglutamate synthase